MKDGRVVESSEPTKNFDSPQTDRNLLDFVRLAALLCHSEGAMLVGQRVPRLLASYGCEALRSSLDGPSIKDTPLALSSLALAKLAVIGRVPVVTEAGERLANLAVLDRQHRDLTDRERDGVVLIAEHIARRLHQHPEWIELPANNEDEILPRTPFSSAGQPAGSPESDSAPLDVSTEFFRSLIEQNLDLIQILDVDGRIRFESLSVTRMLGFSPNERLGSLVWDWVHPEDLRNVGSLYELARREFGTAVSATFRGRHADGSWRVISSSGRGVLDPAGNRCFVVHSRDVTDEQHAAEDREQVFQVSRDLICMAGFDGYFKKVNPAFEKLTGIPATEFLRKPIISFVHPEDVAATEHEIRKLARGLPTSFFENRYRTARGSYLTIAWSATPVLARGLIYGTGRDITRQKEAERTLRESEARVRVLVDQLPVAAWSTDQDLRITSIVGAMLEAFDLDEAKVVGLTMPELFALRGFDGGALEAQRLALGGTSINFEVDYEDRWFQVHIEPLRDEERITGTVGVAFETSERKRAEAERKQLQAELEEARRLDSLSRLAGGVAHDFNNLLVGILGNVDLLRPMLRAKGPELEYLTKIASSASRAAELTRQMLAFSGRGQFFLEAVDLSALAEDLLPRLRTLLPAEAKLDNRLARGQPTIQADPSQIAQAITHLFANACEALGNEGGTLTLATGTEELNADQLRLWNGPVDASAGTYVYVEIADSGCGMDAATQAQMFDPFFSTKFVGRGLGLAAVQGILRGHRGAIRVVSTVGRGSSFRLYFPANEKRIDEADTRLPMVIVADEDHGMRSLCRRMVIRAGFEVEDHRTLTSALDAIEAYPDRRIVLVLDAGLADWQLDGVRERLSELSADHRIVVTGGAGILDAAHLTQGLSLAGYLQKPFVASELVAMLRALLTNR